MTDAEKAKLEALVEAVEAGGVRPPDFIRMASAVFPEGHANALMAYNGSLDAAMRLFASELGARWFFRAHTPNHEEFCVEMERARYEAPLPFGCNLVKARGAPARAWLLAILRALIAEMEGE